ncbi:TPA: rhamnulose-1-phosphate aldolase [Klebsiella pneumoniae]|nr:rhamnulose-1-phosphate aldolase [Klebsiella pneumoniae]
MQTIIDAWFVQGMIKATSDAWLKGWDERNGGNLTLRLDEADIEPYAADFHAQPRYIALSQPMPTLANQPFIVTGSGKFFRNVQLDPAANLGVVKVDSDGAGYHILWGLTEDAVPTSELPAHFLSHSERIKLTGGKDRVIMHCHATNLIALTYVLENHSDLFTRKLWEGSTECLVVFPDGVGILPWMVPGTDEIGQATALIGENGAGKSTLVKVMTGIYQPEEGEILYKAIPIHLPTPESAHKVGITAIHQETVLFDELSVSENIFVGQYLYKGLLKTLDWPAMHRRANEILTRLEVQIDPRATLKTLSIAQRHMVAIARALAFDAQVVILDEPTAALSQHEILEFYHIVERLKQDGKAILFISHKFDEIFELADYYTILRDGVYVSSGAISDITEERMVSMMVGRAISQTYPKVDCTPGETVLEVTDLCHPTEFAHISFRLRKGEILGFYGLVGAGRTELMQALSGVSRPSSGEIRLNGRTMRFHQPADAIRAGIVCVPEERQKQGAIIALPIAQNISLPQLSKLNPNGVLNDAREWRLADEYASRLQVKAFSWRQPVETLSGGNQQKVVIGKWLATQPEVIILDEPTKGIDIGSKAAVHQFMSELVSQGLAVIMVSSELPEVMGMADRIIVMHEGLMVAEYRAGEATAETIVSAASGIGQEAA